MNHRKITFRYGLVAIITVLLTWLIHEYAHWLTSDLYGYETIMRLNGTSPVKGENPTEWHKVIISAAGPIVTILQGFIAFLILKYKSWNKYIYPLLFTAFLMRALAGLMNFNNLNDEGRISAFLGMGTFTLSIVVSGFLFYMVLNISKQHSLNWKFHLGTTLIILSAITVLVLSDQFIGIRII